jgi:deoxyribose-phosphate aldolase
VKVILENCYLTDEQKVYACSMAVQAGADFVKTSTGFGAAGATAKDIQLMRHTVGPKMGVKAAGGVRTIEQVMEMINAGATRIGTSSSVSIMHSLEK